ncbi:conserved protein of unknown function [Agrobacterium pusense]|uniref:Uncharacterized protein n=1 Tax=Agrobacterium pusense TaxID=648995 RepID=U4QF00_9HYPH|nr:conserved protein of unknown function [Agrobacterium pusense]
MPRGELTEQLSEPNFLSLVEPITAAELRHVEDRLGSVRVYGLVVDDLHGALRITEAKRSARLTVPYEFAWMRKERDACTRNDQVFLKLSKETKSSPNGFLRNLNDGRETHVPQQPISEFDDPVRDACRSFGRRSQRTDRPGCRNETAECAGSETGF